MSSKTAQCLIFISHKGGTGKTTSCLSIAGYLAKTGSKVLVVDLDPNANATLGLGVDVKTLNHSMYDVILGQCNGYVGTPIKHVILETDVQNLHVAPAELDLGTVEFFMVQTPNKTRILNQVLENVRDVYDYILIDLPPSSAMLTINALRAADQAFVSLEPSIFSLETIENLKTAFQEIEEMAGHTIGKVTAILIRYAKPNFVSRIRRKYNPSEACEAELKQMFPTVFSIPEDLLTIYESQSKGLPISHSAPESQVGKAYAEIAKHVTTQQARRKTA